MTEFVGFKVEPVDKVLAERASTDAGLSVSAFIRRAVRDAAIRQLAQPENHHYHGSPIEV